MNERMRELAQEANAYAISINPKDGDEFESEFDKKFAELIVQECVNILEKPEYVMTHPEELTDYNRGWVNGRLLGIEHIKEQFGVE